MTHPYRLTRSPISTAGVVFTLVSVEAAASRSAVSRDPAAGLAAPGAGGRWQRVTRRRRDQGGYRPRVVAGFGMPLHGQGEPVMPGTGRQLHRLDDPVRRPGGGDQPVSEPVDGLMVG